jgi:hypothetical protein
MSAEDSTADTSVNQAGTPKTVAAGRYNFPRASHITLASTQLKEGTFADAGIRIRLNNTASEPIYRPRIQRAATICKNTCSANLKSLYRYRVAIATWLMTRNAWNTVIWGINGVGRTFIAPELQAYIRAGDSELEAPMKRVR